MDHLSASLDICRGETAWFSDAYGAFHHAKRLSRPPQPRIILAYSVCQSATTVSIFWNGMAIASFNDAAQCLSTEIFERTLSGAKACVTAKNLIGKKEISDFFEALERSRREQERLKYLNLCRDINSSRSYKAAATRREKKGQNASR